MVIAQPDVVLKQNLKDDYRAESAATFEVLPRLFGFNEDVILRGVKVDYSRQIVYFYFAGEGLLECAIDEQHLKNLIGREGQEAVEVIPPAWENDALKKALNR